MTPEVQKILEGDQLAGARLISLLENRDRRGIEMLRAIYPRTGRAFLIGITGPAGTGKSTLVSRMIGHLRGCGLRVGVVAVDPSSPFNGGALLGDRIRMQGREADAGVFIRSMASRGETGGVSRATREAALVMDAMGYEVVLIETVGVGQGEVAVTHLAHTTAVVSIPGMGDEVQAMKAGLLEIGDVFVVNKSDREGAGELAQLLENIVAMRRCLQGEWRPPVVKTVALRNEGVDRLIDLLFEHRRHLESTGRLAERLARNEFHFFRQLVLEMAAAVLLQDSAELTHLRNDLSRRAIDPYAAAEKLLKASKLLLEGEEKPKSKFGFTVKERTKAYGRKKG
jgi:LAO/AO transport system kinase